MRIHTDGVENIDLDRAAFHAGVTFARKVRHGSRTHKHAWDVTLRGNSRRRPNHGGSGAAEGYAATWDQWGIFLAHLYNEDATMRCAGAYKDIDEFDFKTGERFWLTFNRETGEFDGFELKDSHGDHKFESLVRAGGQQCNCGAVRRW